MKLSSDKNTHSSMRLARKIGTIMSGQEVAENDILLHSDNPEYNELFQQLSDPDTLSDKISKFDRPVPFNRQEALVRELQRKLHRQRIRRVVTIAASTAAVIAIAVFLTTLSDFRRNTSHSSRGSVPQITLADGRVIELNSSNQTQTAALGITLENSQNSIKIESPATTESSVSRFNTIQIPERYTFTVTLTDGTRIRMNAGSTLRYPENFSPNQREVFLTGEAFFEVSKSPIPFQVHVSDITVNVYGTRFNICEHPNGICETILVEGSVGIRNGVLETRITPSQRYIYNSINKSGRVDQVTCDDHLGWLDNKFQYERRNLSEILLDFENWYGITFDYNEKAVSDIELTLSVDRSQSVEDILQIIQNITGLSIEKKGGSEYLIK